MPFWRRPLTEIAYAPLTRVDVRRMHKIGELDFSGVQRAYLDLGYNLERATQLARFTEILNGQDEKAELESARGPYKTQIIRAYTEYNIGRDEADGLLQSLDYSETERRVFLSAADIDRAVDRATVIQRTARDGYLRGVRDAADTRALLSANAFRGDAIDSLLSMWDVEASTRILTENERVERDLTKTEIMGAYEAEILTAAEVSPMLLDLGYSDSEARTLISLSDVRMVKAAVAAEQDAIKAQYIAALITRGEASNQLDAMGTAARTRNALLARWDVERAARTADIPLSTVEGMIRNAILSPVEAREELKGHGYADKQIDRLLRLWGVPRAEIEASAGRGSGQPPRSR
jgi:hypothetical protein